MIWRSFSLIGRIWLISLACVSSLLAACGSSEGGSPEGSGVKPAVGGFGGRLQQGASYSVVLFVLGESGDSIDLAGVACAPGGTLGSGVVTVDEAVPIDGGSFRAESKDVAIEGAFVSPTRAEGTARPLTADAESCGIGEGSTWRSDCDLSVKREEQKEPEGGLVIGGTTLTTDGGTAFGLLEVVAESGDRLVGELLDSGTCGT